MWAHQAIGDLSEFLKAETGDENYRAACTDVLKFLKKSQHFYLGHCVEYIDLMKRSSNSRVFFEENAVSVKLPYDICCFWFDNSNNYETDQKIKIKRKAVVCMKDTRRVNESFILMSLNYLVNSGKWILDPHAVCISVGVDYKAGDHGPKNFAIYSGNMIIFPLFQHKREYTEFEKTEIIKDFQQELSALNAVLMLLSCQNISYETIEPPAKLNKKRRKKGKEEMVKYHVLNLHPLSSKTISKSGVQTEETKRVHLCRGHFKTFTEDKPLFGRFTGRYWWQPQVRGDKEKGIVNKDYKVEV